MTRTPIYFVTYGAHGYTLSFDLDDRTAADVNRAKNAARRLYSEGFYCNLCKHHHGVTWVKVTASFGTCYLRLAETT